METKLLELSMRDLGLKEPRVADRKGDKTRKPTPVRNTQQAEIDIRP